MTTDAIIKHAERFFNTLALSGIFLILFLTLVFQIFFHALPCPLCLLQRIGFLSVAIGFLLNLRFGLRPSHYAISLFSALFTSFVALRQVALHVLPGTGSYGDPLLGWHLYTWSFIIAMVFVVTTIFMLAVDQQYQRTNKTVHSHLYIHIAFVVAVILLLSNIISVGFVCGFGECPENPTHYIISL